MQSARKLWNWLWQKHGGLISFLIFLLIFLSFIIYNINQGPENDRKLAVISLEIIQEIDKQNLQLIEVSKVLPNKIENYTLVTTRIENITKTTKDFQSKLKGQSNLTKAGQSLLSQTESFLDSNQKVIDGLSLGFDSNAKILPTFESLARLKSNVEELASQADLVERARVYQIIINYNNNISENLIDIGRQGVLLLEIKADRVKLEKLNVIINSIPDGASLDQSKADEIKTIFGDKWPVIPGFPVVDSKVLVGGDYVDARTSIIDGVRAVTNAKK